MCCMTYDSRNGSTMTREARNCKSTNRKSVKDTDSQLSIIGSDEKDIYDVAWLSCAGLE